MITLQPMATAPRDRVILTNLGFARFGNWANVRKQGWFLCLPCGHISYCVNEDMEISRIEPMGWAELPEFVLLS